MLTILEYREHLPKQHSCPVQIRIFLSHRQYRSMASDTVTTRLVRPVRDLAFPDGHVASEYRGAVHRHGKRCQPEALPPNSKRGADFMNLLRARGPMVPRERHIPVSAPKTHSRWLDIYRRVWDARQAMPCMPNIPPVLARWRAREKYLFRRKRDGKRLKKSERYA